MKTYEEQRRISIQLALDTNCINARQSDPDLNQLEQWQRDGIISIIMPRTAYDEASRGGNRKRAIKASAHVYSITLATTAQERQLLRRIEQILFPGGANSASERNDVDIVFNARKYQAILVTHDGGSKRQPDGILGNRESLRALGITVMTAREAVEYVRVKLAERDARARWVAIREGLEPPDWVGKD